MRRIFPPASPLDRNMSARLLVVTLGAFQTLAMALGGAVVALREKFSREYAGFMLSMASSLMLGVAFFELLKEALEKLHELPSRGGAGWVIPAAFMTGVILVSVVDHLLPHWHHHQGRISHQHEEAGQSGWILLFGFLIHDFPEGVCIGAGYAINPSFGLLVGISMFLSNIIEGITLSLKFDQEKKLNMQSLLARVSIPGLAVLAGSVAGFYGCRYFGEVHYALALALAAGAIVFVIIDELIPEAYATNSHPQILWGFISGFGLVCFMSILSAF
ncbi:MAG: ZIP family metal transporter [bacterium]